jgi:hypothetical protein
MLRLPSNLAGVSRLAAAEDTRCALSCIRVAEREGGYEIQATDGKRLVIITGLGREEQTLAMLSDAPNGASVTLIPAKDWGKTLKAARKHDAYAVLGENGRLTFRYWKPSRPFVIETRNDAGQNLFSLMMPIS